MEDQEKQSQPISDVAPQTDQPSTPTQAPVATPPESKEPPVQDPLADDPKPKKDGLKGSNNTMLAIILAVIFGLIIIGLGYQAYRQDQTNSESITTQKKTTSNDDVVDAGTNTADEVDVTGSITELDAALGALDDETDFDDSLDSESLGF